MSKKEMSKEEIEKIKQKLDLLNYNVPNNEKIFDKDNWTQGEKISYLTEYTASDIVLKDFCYTQDILTKINQSTEDKLHLGVISSGVHTYDFQNFFGFDITKDWNSTPIMFVYECPHSNLNASFAHSVDNVIKYEKGSDTNTLANKLLCDRLWHADYGKEEFINNKKSYGNNNFKNFDKAKKYSLFLLSLILEFKLENFYSTNIFKYEIFKISKNKEGHKFDSALNLKDILWPKDKQLKETCSSLLITKNDNSPFIKELEILQPQVIFATSNPYWCIKDYLSTHKKNYNIVLVKVPHPASRDSSATRFLKNVINIVSALEKANVINSSTATNKIESAYERYKEIILYNSICDFNNY